jgi:acetyltransferase-like isoleucine patch superfamily enzyme
MTQVLTRVFENLAIVTGIILSPILNYRAKNRFGLFADIAFTAANRKYFRSFGRRARIGRKTTLINPQCMIIGEGSTVGANSVISAWTSYRNKSYTPLIKIGQNTSIGAYFHLTAIDQISIGNGVLMGMHVTISDNAHGVSEAGELATPPMQRPLVKKGSIEIGDNVWIGSKTTILSGVRIGKGAIVAANAVVVHDVKEATVVAGVPAVPVKEMKP